MDDIYVTILIDGDDREIMPNMTGENSKSHAQQKAEYWAGLGHTAKIGRVEIIEEGDKSQEDTEAEIIERLHTA